MESCEGKSPYYKGVVLKRAIRALLDNYDERMCSGRGCWENVLGYAGSLGGVADGAAFALFRWKVMEFRAKCSKCDYEDN